MKTLLKTALCGVVAFTVFPVMLPAMAETLPVYKVQTAQYDAAVAQKLFTESFGAEKAQRLDQRLRKDALILGDGSKVLEFDQRSGHWFAADKAKLWKSTRDGKVPEKNDAASIAAKFADQFNLIPVSDKVKFDRRTIVETAVGDDTPDSLDKTVLDYTVTWGASIEVNGQAYPVVGGGSEYSVTVGTNGEVISFMGGWRPIVDEAAQVEIAPPEEAIQSFEKLTDSVKYQNLKAEIAYYAAPAFEKQEMLAPVYVISGEMVNGEEIIPLRPQIIAATQFGPVFEQGPKPEFRSPKLRAPKPGRKDDEGSEKFGLLDIIAPPAMAAGGLECGTSWIGTSQGLPGSSGNRQGFVNKCRDAGWSVNFDWGDNNAFESDWRRNDDSYIDAADLVFYTGHASQNGWNAVNPDDTFVHFSEVSGASDMWGQLDLEWLIVAACGPLQSSHFVTNTTNAFSRWRDAFDGLHVLMGYGAVTYDNTSEGRRFMELALGGDDVISAWFRTAREIQPATNSSNAPDGPTIFVTAMYAHNGDHCTENDHLHGHGAVCPDVRGSAQRRSMMWSGT